MQRCWLAMNGEKATDFGLIESIPLVKFCVEEAIWISLKFYVGAAKLLFTIAPMFRFHLQYSPRLRVQAQPGWNSDHDEPERVSFMHWIQWITWWNLFSAFAIAHKYFPCDGKRCQESKCRKKFCQFRASLPMKKGTGRLSFWHKSAIFDNSLRFILNLSECW